MKKNRQVFDLERQLDSVPLHNTRVRCLATAAAGIPLLEVDLQYAGWIRLLSRLLLRRLRQKRRIQLDLLGWEVFEQIDGQQTFEQLVEHFAKAHQLGFLESRALLAAHIRNLMKVGLVVINARRKGAP